MRELGSVGGRESGRSRAKKARSKSRSEDDEDEEDDDEEASEEDLVMELIQHPIGRGIARSQGLDPDKLIAGETSELIKAQGVMEKLKQEGSGTAISTARPGGFM
jgi:hypothetical protein